MYKYIYLFSVVAAIIVSKLIGDPSTSGLTLAVVIAGFYYVIYTLDEILKK